RIPLNDFWKSIDLNVPAIRCALEPFGDDNRLNNWPESGTVLLEWRMRKLLAVAAILIFFGPIVGVYLGMHPAILPFLGIACGLAAAVCGAQPMLHCNGAPSPGAEADAKILCNTTVNYSRNSGIGITDVGGAA